MPSRRSLRQTARQAKIAEELLRTHDAEFVRRKIFELAQRQELISLRFVAQHLKIDAKKRPKKQAPEPPSPRNRLLDDWVMEAEAV
jgi:hypothetical protein